jgi:hypothetical protein
MTNKEAQPIQETPPLKTETWLIDPHSFNNGFWNDKQTFETTIISQDGEKVHYQTGQWELQHQGEAIAKAISCVFSDIGLPWIKIDPYPGITPNQKKALEDSLEYYGAVKTV